MTYSIGRHTGYEHNRLVAYLVGGSGWGWYNHPNHNRVYGWQYRTGI